MDFYSQTIFGNDEEIHVFCCQRRAFLGKGRALYNYESTVVTRKS
jgi:hypothetical protein